MKQIMFGFSSWMHSRAGVKEKHYLCPAAVHGRFAEIIYLFFLWFGHLMKVNRIDPNAALSISSVGEMGTKQ